MEGGRLTKATFNSGRAPANNRSAIRSLETTHRDSFVPSVRDERKRVSLKSPVRGLLGNWQSYRDGGLCLGE